MQRIRTQSDGEQLTPYVAGTDVSVNSVLALIDRGCSYQEIQVGYYPDITPADIHACVEYAGRRPGDDLTLIGSKRARYTGFRPGFWVEFGMPLLLLTLLAALVMVYFRTSARVSPERVQAQIQPQTAVPPPVIPKPPQQLAIPFKQQGDAAYASGQYVEAERWYHKALDAEPTNAAVVLNLGLAYYRQQRFAAAEVQYRYAAALDPADATAHYDLGLLFSAQARFHDAKSEFMLALALKPDDADFHYSLGKVYCDLRDYDDAIPQFDRALEIEPTHKFARLSLKYAKKMKIRPLKTPEADRSDPETQAADRP